MRNVRTCRPDTVADNWADALGRRREGEPPSGGDREGQSTDAGHRDGPSRSSDEAR